MALGRSTGLYGDLDLEQKVALLSLLRAAAEAELDTEDARVKLCELPDFKPRACFQAIQGPSVKGWMSSSELHLWFTSQPHPVAGYRLEDVLAAVKLRTGSLEIFPEDFIRMTTPNFRSGAYLKELALSRLPMGYLPYEQPLKAEVAYRLSQLFLLELDFVSRLRFHQKRLRQVALYGGNIVKFLDADEGFCAGMGGLLSASAVRHVLSRGVAGYTRPLEPMLCDALLKRINPNDAAFFPADNLGRLLDMTLPPATAYPTWADRLVDYPYRSLSPTRLSFDSPLRQRPMSPRRFLEPGSPAAYATSPVSPTTPLPDYLLPDSRPPRHHGQKDDLRSPSPTRRHYLSELSTQDPGLSRERSLYDSFVSSPAARALSPGASLREPRGLSPAASPGISPALGSPLPRRSLFLDSHEQRCLQQTLVVMARQAKLDVMVEDAKALLPTTCTVEEIFNELDLMRNGYITLRDIRRFMAGFGFTAKYASYTAVVSELHLRRKIFNKHSTLGSMLLPDSLDLRDVAMLTLPLIGGGCKAVMGASSDEDAKSVLSLLRKSTVQGFPLTSSAKHSLYRLLGTVLEAAEELDLDRRELARFLAQEICGLCDVFGAMASGPDSLGFTQGDLRRCFAAQGLPLPTGEQWDLLWCRYAAPDATSVTFLDFKSQLTPMF
mmetsp:Transcript_40164/g.92913  ORF Transcript_40164/g.92913 Transcript_40164/m.92913 type:complete len:664 (-) Transcript_40164:54-2045(-)